MGGQENERGVRVSQEIRIPVLGAIVAAFGFLAGCGPTTIAAMGARPAKYEGKSVEITARVIDTRDVPLTNNDYYKITDNSGEIWVLTTRGLPLRGLEYKIKGEYRKPGGPVAEAFLGTYILRESKREELVE